MTPNALSPRITIRVASGSLAFAMADATLSEQLRWEPFVAKSGVSMAANLREAFKNADLLQLPNPRAQVLIDTPCLPIPIEEYQEEDCETLYLHAFPSTESSVVMTNILPELHAAALFAVNKDLKTVVEDHFSDVRFIALMRPIWTYMHRRGMSRDQRKLYVYFHDGKMEVFCFERNRFLFSNVYTTRNTQDAIYFILFVWKQLVLNQQKDELYIAGNIPDKDTLLQKMKEYISKVTIINPAADFNRAPMTTMKGITLDVITLYLG